MENMGIFFILHRVRIHLSLCANLFFQVCKPGPSLPSWPGCLLPSPGPWTVQKGSRAILPHSTFQDERIVLSNVTGLGVCITNVCPNSKEVILASVPVLNFSGVYRGSLRGRVWVWEVPGSRGNDTLDGRGKGDFKKYEEQCHCIHQHFETFDQKSKHNHIHNLKQVECWCKYCCCYLQD